MTDSRNRLHRVTIRKTNEIHSYFDVRSGSERLLEQRLAGRQHTAGRFGHYYARLARRKAVLPC